MNAINFVQEEMIREMNYPDFRAGDNVIVSYKIVEGTKERIQSFRGNVIQIKGTGATKTFTVRKVSKGYGIERIFPLLLPTIDKIEVVKEMAVRRSKLYFIRDKRKKKKKLKEKSSKDTK